MAFNAKPNVEGLGKEAPYELLDHYVKNSAVGLFDGVCVNEWDTNRVCYWNGAGTYVTVEIGEDCNIWRSGTSNWSDYTHSFTIHKLSEDGTFVDVTDGITQTRENIKEYQWSKCISDLKAGTYKFIYTGLRLDSEWYIESTEEPEPPKYSALSINKTLKENLPTKTDRDELHFTEDGGIYINDKDGNLIQCKTGDLVREISNPLTTSPLEYAQFKLSEPTGVLVTGDVVPFDVVVSGNIAINSGVVTLRQGKTYEVDGSVFIQYNGSDGRATMWIKDLTNGVNLGTGSSAYATSTTSYLRGNNTSAKAIVTPDNDIEVALVIGSVYGNEIKAINQNMSTLIVKEVRNNPVNQYGGFETQLLFDGKGGVGEYTLSDSVLNYDFLFVTSELKVADNGDSIIPKMTSNTAPAPYVASASTEVEKACGAFDTVAGKYGQTWYSSGGFPQWLNIFCGVPTNVGKFSLTNGSSDSGYHNYPPKSFIFQGSNDGVTYDDILEVKDMPRLGHMQEITYVLDKAVEYSNYRWYFTEGYSSAIIIGEAKLFGEHIPNEVTNVIVPVGKKINHMTMYDFSITFSLNNDNLAVFTSSELEITRVVGVKGQLPSLLVGGEF